MLAKLSDNSFYMRITSLGLRGSAMGGRFLLLVVMAKFLTPAELGLFGLIRASIGYGLFFLGLEFYTYATREIIKRNGTNWGDLLVNQIFLTLVLYILIFPVLAALMSLGLLPSIYIELLFMLLILEHLTQEMIRLLIAVSEPVFASLIIFFRTGSWAIILTVILFLEPSLRDLEYVLLGWLLGVIVALMLGCWRLHRVGIRGWTWRVDVSWILTGLMVAFPFLLSSLAIRGVLVLDRYFVLNLANQDVLGAYSLYFGLANILISVLEAAVFTFIYPSMIRAVQSGDLPGFSSELKRLAYQTLGCSMLFASVITMLANPLITWLDKPVYVEEFRIFYWILFANILYGLSMIPHYALYAKGYDRAIVYSHLLAFFVFVGSSFVLADHYSVLSIPYAMCIAFGFVLLWKATVFIILDKSPSAEI